MASPEDALTPEFVNPQKGRTGLNRLWHATGYSMAGLRVGWDEPAFRLEACLAVLLLPLAFFVGRSWVEIALLAGSVLLVLITELLNCGIEFAIDRISLEHHPLSRKAKDVGSAAVLLAVLLAGGIWLAALRQFFFA